MLVSRHGLPNCEEWAVFATSPEVSEYRGTGKSVRVIIISEKEEA